MKVGVKPTYLSRIFQFHAFSEYLEKVHLFSYNQ